MEDDIVCGYCADTFAPQEDSALLTEELVAQAGWKNTEMGWVCMGCSATLLAEDEFEVPDAEGQIALAKIFFKFKKD